MTYRALFTDQEWQTIQFMPLWAFTAVAASDGKIDDQETKALIKSLSEGVLLKGALPREVFVSIATDFGTILPAYKADARMAYPGLAEGASLLTRAEPDQAAMFKFAVMAAAKDAAEASGGFAAPKVSQQESAAWGMVASVIGFDLKAAEAALARA